MPSRLSVTAESEPAVVNRCTGPPLAPTGFPNWSLSVTVADVVCDGPTWRLPLAVVIVDWASEAPAGSTASVELAVLPPYVAVTVYEPTVLEVQVAPVQEVPDGAGRIASDAEPLTSAIRFPCASNASTVYVWLFPATIVEPGDGEIVVWSGGPGSNVTDAVCVTPAVL